MIITRYFGNPKIRIFNMRHIRIHAMRSISALLMVMLVSGGAHADKPPRGEKHREQSTNDRNTQKYKHADHHRDQRKHDQKYFTEQHRVVIHNYFSEERDHGRCPPGLAKKRNGCTAPGLARQWVVGRPLAREVKYYELPPTVVVNLGVPPAGYRYVRVASDILLIAAGTGLVLDALADLSAQ